MAEPGCRWADYVAPSVTVHVDEHQPRVQTCTFDSPALGRPAECLVIAPARSPTATLPVLYLLHGSDDQPRCWVDKTPLLELSAETDAVIVAPEGGVVGYYTDWVHPGADGNRPGWERFHLEEIPRVLLGRAPVEKRFTIAGISMGGYGALTYACLYPDRFRAVASLSGLPHITKRSISAFVRFTVRRQGEPAHAPFGDPRGGDSVWTARDPFHNATRLMDTPVYLAWGTGRRLAGERAFVGSGLIERLVAHAHRDFVARLRSHGVTPVTSVHMGTHDWPYWQRELPRAWSFLVENMRSGG